MNNKLLTVAITAALVAPTAVLADVTVYGQLHMSVDYTDSDTVAAAGATDSNISVSSNSSRLGFKGDEDLGGGLKAVWQIESRIGMEEGQGSTDNVATSGLASRNTYLGLAGGFGTVLVGKHDTPFKLLERSLDPFADTIADTRQIFGSNLGDGVGFNLRPSNVIAYITPTFSGFNAVLAYVAGATSNVTGADNNKLDAFSLNATYKNGPIYAGIAYETHSKQINGAVNDPSGLRIGGSYTFGPATIGGMYELLTDFTPLAAESERGAGTIFGTYTFGMETIKLAYTMADEFDIGGVNLQNSGADLFAIGIDHKFSKRTTAYAQFTALSNDTFSGYSLGGGNGGGYGDAVTPAVGGEPNAISVGLIHKF